MNKIFKLFSILSLVTIVFFACTPDQYELKAPLDKSALKFSVTRDATNPNKFILKSLTPNAQPYWETPVGTSVKLNDTIVVPFPGKDTIFYSVETPGGIVKAEPYAFEVTTIDEAYVNGPMWTNLAGGFGKSKTWVLDIDANGKSKYFVGPMFFAGPYYSWEWDAGWGTWIMPAADYGTMTFDLIGNANFTSDNKTLPEGLKTGKFMLYTATNQLKTYGAQVVHDMAVNPDGSKSSGYRVVNWDAKVLIKSLDADHMQLIEVGDGGGIWLIYNYISKDYYDSH